MTSDTNDTQQNQIAPLSVDSTVVVTSSTTPQINTQPRPAVAALDPYQKGFRLSVILHVALVGSLLLGIVGEAILHNVRPQQQIFTIRAAPAGAIAGGDASTPSHSEASEVAPASPKLPSPAPAEDTSASEEVFKPVSPAEALPKPPRIESPKAVMPKAPKPPKTKVAPKEPKPEKLSYADWLKQQKKKNPTKSGTASTAKPKAKPQQVAPSGGPSFEESLASRLGDKLRSGKANVGTGTGGPAGSGQIGDGIAGATMDETSLYSGALYTYFNSVWEEPKETGNVRLSCDVSFVVDNEGNVSQWRITRRSGVDTFDRSVVRVFEKVKTVTSPPASLGAPVRLTVTFETKDS